MQEESFEQSEPESTKPKPDTNRVRRLQKFEPRRKWKIFATVLVFVVIATVAASQGYGYFKLQKLVNQIPVAIRSSINFDIYLPTLSKVVLDKQTFSYSGGVLQFNAVVDGVKLNFSEQSKPADFDISKFLTGDGLTGAKQLNVPSGTALLGTLKGRTIAIIDTNQTIVTITNSGAESGGILESVVQSLRKV